LAGEKTETVATKGMEEVLAEARQEAKIELVQIQETGVGWLNARSGPGRNYEIVTRVTPGEEFKLVTSEGEWYEIMHEASSTVWVSQLYAIIINN
jgi:uncharacterized protein YgiM (DUF1202 family)